MKTEKENIWDPAGRRGNGKPPYKVTNPHTGQYWWCYSSNTANTRKELGETRVSKEPEVDTLKVRHASGCVETYYLYEFRGALYYVRGTTYIPDELK